MSNICTYVYCVVASTVRVPYEHEARVLNMYVVCVDVDVHSTMYVLEPLARTVLFASRLLITRQQVYSRTSE